MKTMETAVQCINSQQCEETKVANDVKVNKKSERQEVKGKLNKNEKINRTRKLSKKPSNKETRAYQALKKSFNFVEFFGQPLGWSMEYEWKNNARSRFVMCYLIFTWSQVFYSQFQYFENGDHIKFFKVFAVYGVAVSCLLKVFCFIGSVEQLTAVFKFSFKLCQHTVGKRAVKLENKQRFNFKISKWITFFAFLSAWLYIFYPIKAFIEHRELVPLLPIEIMFADQTILSGFLIANTLMVVMGLYAVAASLYMGLHFIAAILNYSMQIDLIEFDVKELDELWSNKTKASSSDRHRLLRQICQKCQDKDNYIMEVKKIFDNTIYLYFCFAFVSQIVCLYEVKAENWIPGYGIAFGLFFEMMFYCAIGTKSAIENERLCYIFSQSNWYTYDVYSQKTFLVLLQSSMTTKGLWIGPLAPLGVYTGTEIVKSIYSYYTLLMEVM